MINWNSHINVVLLALLAVFPLAAQEQQPLESQGEKLFNSYCAACHQYDNQGMGEAPPLENSPWVAGPLERLTRIVLHGVKGRMEIAGKVYDREMPGFGQMLADDQIADLLLYVRETFNKDGKPVKAEQIRKIRKEHSARTEYWTVDELLDQN